MMANALTRSEAAAGRVRRGGSMSTGTMVESGGDTTPLSWRTDNCRSHHRLPESLVSQMQAVLGQTLQSGPLDHRRQDGML
jgi:hypothetical protein